MSDRWLLYGATGYTGRLTAVEAVERGHRPVLAGRSGSKLRSLSEKLDLDYVVCNLEQKGRLRKILRDFDLVCHLAGPYKFTFEPMLRACLEEQTHYLDISGEIPTLRAVQSFDRQARRGNVAIVPAAGFVSVPTDCSARLAAQQIPKPIRLETAVATEAGPSPGTIKTMLETLPEGFVVRADNQLVPRPIGGSSRRVTFMDGDRPVISTPQADLITGHRSTGIPNITTYLGVPDGSSTLFELLGPTARRLVSNPRVRSLLQRLIERYLHGPDADLRRTARSYTWVRTVNEAGAEAEVWLETGEAYQFTAHAVVRAAEHILAERPKGVLTPGQAFGEDFPLEITGTRRFVRNSL